MSSLAGLFPNKPAKSAKKILNFPDVMYLTTTKTAAAAGAIDNDDEHGLKVILYLFLL